MEGAIALLSSITKRPEYGIEELDISVNMTGTSTEQQIDFVVQAFMVLVSSSSRMFWLMSSS